MADLLPGAVVVRESADPAGWRASDWPEEQAAVAKAVPRRQVQHGAVRRLAREALAEIGVAPGPILSGERREPRWPVGVVGSLTHTVGYCAAAVARADEVLSVGIDAEGDAPLGPGLVRRLTQPDEVAALDWFDADVGARAKALFSVKESIYKAWFPVTHRWLGFDDVEVRCRPGSDAHGTFVARVRVDAPRELSEISGTFERSDGFVRAASLVLRS
jgi:4'-phosphopantetheinyl transferase EntD